MRKHRMRLLVLAMLMSMTAVLTAEQLYPVGDLNQNFKVNLEDLAIFAEQWMEFSACTGLNCAELDGLNGINIFDFDLLAANWLEDFGVPLALNEFMASNTGAGGILDPQGQSDDWIEIYNFGDTTIDLAGMYLTDDVDNPTAWQFPLDRPADTVIDPNGFLIVWADGDIGDTPGLHADFQLDAGGEEIALFDTDGTIQIDSIVYEDQVSDISYGRLPDGNADLRFFAVPTPGMPNQNAYMGLVADTKFSHNRGFYDAPFSLIITCDTPGARIYYTADGSDPIENEAPAAGAAQYTGPVSISTNTAFRAAAIKTGWMPTNIDTHTYIFGAGQAARSMPVVCLVGDEYETFYGPDGILPNATLRGIQWERPVSFEFIDLSNGVAFQEDCGIRVHGSDYTRPRYTIGEDWDTCWINWWPNWNSNKFSFNLWFRSEYGNSRLEYPMFPFINVDRFESIVLRAGHNDGCTPFVKDEWTRRLFQEMGHPQVTGIFGGFYLNGQYKSYYNPTARSDKEFYQEWYGTNNEFDVITQSGVRDGDNVAWNNLLNYANSHDLSNTADYEYVASRLDIPTFIDYLILQIHIGNFDWPGNNWDAHRERSGEGKFRFSIWDAEGLAETWIFGNNGENMYKTAFEDFPDWSNPRGLNNMTWEPNSQLYLALKANPEFRQLFADHVHTLFRNDGILTEEHLLAKWWEVFNEVAPVLPETSNFPVRYVPDTFIPLREMYVLDAFENNGLIDLGFGYPVFNINGSYHHGGYVSSGDNFTITQSTASGTLYYTTDGSDPRVPASMQTVTEGLSVLDSAPKKVLVPTGDIGTGWRGGSEPYDDSAWISGTGGVGYERGTGYESLININVETQMYDHNATCYVRIPFTVDGDDLPYYSSLELRLRYDDGFVAYINGTEVRRVNAPSSLQWNSPSNGDHEASAAWDIYDISAYISALHAGDNILAIHGLNTLTTSSDFLISAELVVPSGVVGTQPSLAPTAIEYTGGFPLTKSTQIKARILSGSPATGQWSVLNEAVYGVGPVAESLRISEIMYHPADPNTEFIELINVGSQPVNLNLVRLTKGVDFTFGDEVLDPGQRILVVENQADFLQRYPSFTGRIAGRYEGNLDNGGEKIRLRDALGAVIQEFTYKDGWYDITDGDGFSLTIRDAYAVDPNLWDSKDGWRPSAAVGGSPGTDDAGLLPDPGSVVINEVLAHSHTSNPDWIELHNTTGQPINIGEWFLSDDDSDDPNIMKYQIAAGTSIPAGGYVLFYETVHFGNPGAPGVNTPFALSEGGDAVYLRSGLGDVIGGYEDSESFGASTSNVAFGRHIKSTLDGGVNFVAMSVNTPGAENAYPMVGPVVITEIMYNPDPANTGGEYLELHNITGSTVTLQDSVSTETAPDVFTTDEVPWKFSDGIEFVFPADTTIPAGGYLVIAADPAAFTAYYGAMPSGVEVLGPFLNGSALSNGGEQVQIVRPGDQEYGSDRYWIRTERVTYDDEAPWPVTPDGGGEVLVQKTPDTPGANYSNDVINWQAAAPDPGQ